MKIHRVKELTFKKAKVWDRAVDFHGISKRFAPKVLRVSVNTFRRSPFSPAVSARHFSPFLGKREGEDPHTPAAAASFKGSEHFLLGFDVPLKNCYKEVASL